MKKIVLFLIVAISALPTAAAAQSGSAETGKRLFMKNNC